MAGAILFTLMNCVLPTVDGQPLKPLPSDAPRDLRPKFVLDLEADEGEDECLSEDAPSSADSGELPDTGSTEPEPEHTPNAAGDNMLLVQLVEKGTPLEKLPWCAQCGQSIHPETCLISCEIIHDLHASCFAMFAACRSKAFALEMMDALDKISFQASPKLKSIIFLVVGEILDITGYKPLPFPRSGEACTLADEVIEREPSETHSQDTTLILGECSDGGCDLSPDQTRGPCFGARSSGSPVQCEDSQAP